MTRPRSTTQRRRRRLAAAAILLHLTAGVSTSAAAEPTPGSSGTDTALPATPSKVTVGGRGRFADLKVTVNQTKNLVNQAVSINWTGGTPTSRGPSDFARNYLQIMQCWGDDDGAVKDNPGPPPEQCVQGATDGVPGGRNGSVFPAGGFALQRIISQKGLWPGFDAADGHLDEKTGFLWKPFRAVDGKVVNVQADLDYDPALGNYWLNPYFNFITTNEIAGGRTGPNGEGAELFEINTGVESAGLGCGQAVGPVAAGRPAVPKCWLVIVPRSAPEEENAGSPHDAGRGVMTSPLSPGAWKNRIAIPLEFNLVDSACSLADDQRRIVGTELAIGAVSSWQPKLCSTPGLPPYAYGVASDSAARQQLLGGAAGAPGMIVVSRPLEPARLDPSRPVVYAPIAVSALGIGFNVERNPRADAGTQAAALKGVRVSNLNLTPRLVAKLLTQSYTSQVAIKGSLPPKYEWAAKNPRHLGLDPEFLRFNAEFELLANGGKNFGGLVLNSRNSDGARQVWEWVLADPEARVWLDGAPDQWGMAVNPLYATTAKGNIAGAAFADPIPDSFPKSDPYCYQGPPVGSRGTVIPPALCGTDWLPYAQGLRDAARQTRAADDGARTLEDPAAPSPDKVYKPDGPQLIGSRTILSLTDSASAAQFGIQMARLSRAGDNGADRKFIAPDVAGLTAGVGAMAARDEPSVLEPAPKAAAPDAYPLTTLAYAATSPLSLDDQARTEYAAFVDYAAGPGQAVGLEIGQLPRGFAPLPAALKAQATAAAKAIRELKPATTPVDPPAGSPTTTASPTNAMAATAEETAPASFASPGGGGQSSAAAAPSPPEQPPPASTPATTATTRPPATRPTLFTPVVAMAGSRFVLPGLLGVALLSALGVLEITKRPRRVPGAGTGGSARLDGTATSRSAALRGGMSQWLKRS